MMPLIAIAGGSLYGTDFAMQFTTTGASETLTIPCQNVGTFNATIDWGDGGPTSAITAYNDANLVHTYAVAGDYDVRISGTFPNIQFNNAGDKLKLKQIYQLGSVGLTRLDRAFWGCTNLTSACAHAVNNTAAVTNLYTTFYNCTGLTTLDVSSWNTAAVTNMSYMFLGCSSLTTLDVSSWNTAAVTTMYAMFYNCTGLTTLDVSSWNTAAVTNMGNMFFNCTGLTDIAIDGWNIAAVTNLINYMTNVTLPTTRYDATLVAWDAQAVKPSLSVDFGGSKYTLGSAADTARAHLVSADLWTILDAGGI